MKNLFLYIITAIVAISFIACKNNNNKINDDGTNNTAASNVKPISFSIIKTYPHDTASFTQGLIVYKGQMFEGTGGSSYDEGGPKQSRLMKVNLQTGKAEKTIDIPTRYFGEGITILNDTLYQLTWKEHTVFVYTLPDLKKIKEFSINTEGWGITHNGKELIISDGSSNLQYYEPSTFKLLRNQSVTLNGELVNNLNELEFINGYVYANQWTLPYIFKIDPSNGQIVGRIDLSQVWDKLKAADPGAAYNVPNGIAYDADSKKIYITGKNWPELYEIQLGQ